MYQEVQLLNKGGLSVLLFIISYNNRLFIAAKAEDQRRSEALSVK
jgi:hypothetical protein